MLRFYDQLRRQGQQVVRFEELLEDMLRRDAEFDRGAERMLQQTRLLAATFRAYERRVAASGGCDEHALRERLIVDSSSSPARAVVIAVAGQLPIPRRCRRFRLPTRMPGWGRSIWSSPSACCIGFHQRIRDWLPPAEIDWNRPARLLPTLSVPTATQIGNGFERDREGLTGIARRLKADVEKRVGRTRVRPGTRRGLQSGRCRTSYLPVVGGARIPHQSSDAASQPRPRAPPLIWCSIRRLIVHPHGGMIAPHRSPVSRSGTACPVPRPRFSTGR